MLEIENHFELEHDESHQVFHTIAAVRMKNMQKRFEEEEKTKIKVKVTPEPVTQKTEPPVFTHPEIEMLYGYVKTSKIRLGILEIMNNNKTLSQMEIANKLNQKQQNISKAVKDMIQKNLIKSLTPDKQAWNIYTITEKGKEVYDFIKNFENS